MRTCAVAAALVVLLASGCSSAIEGVAEDALATETGGRVDLHEGGYALTDDTGTVWVGTHLPEGFPIPILNGGRVVSALERSQADRAVYVAEITYPATRYGDLVEFYDAYAASLDDPVARSISEGEPPGITWATDRHPRTIVQLTAGPSGNTIAISWGL